MKKTFLSILLLGLIASPFVSAKKKNKPQTKNNPEVAITSANDSLSYAYGKELSENGLEGYLHQAGILINTSKISSDYDSRIANAATPQEKEKLNKELEVKLDSANTANTANIQEFVKGVSARLSEADANKAYNTGLDIGSQLQRMIEGFLTETGLEKDAINNQALLLGFSKALTKEQPLIENSKQIMEDKMSLAAEKKNEEKKKQYAETIETGNKFMKDNALQDGVVTLPNGLQYKILVEGNGEKPTPSDRVRVHYTGKLIDGTTFDSSVDRGEPIVFGVTEVIPGWTEILQMMPVGSKWMVYIPYDLAYNDRDSGPIKPYSNLVFEIELLEIVK